MGQFHLAGKMEGSFALPFPQAFQQHLVDSHPMQQTKQSVPPGIMFIQGGVV
jgi:hypothetical protein